MNSMQNIWSKRFLHYIGEVQKYMRFVFTGHIAIVLVFVVGAGGYQYSEWLKVAPNDFPAEWLVAVLVGVILAFSAPTTLIREPDQVYLLPLETKMPIYFKKALNWTFISQLLLSIATYIVAIPLLNTVTALPVSQIWIGLFVIILLKYLNVQMEFNYRYSNRGQLIWIDRIARMIMSILIIHSILTSGLVLGVILLVIVTTYHVFLIKRVADEPVPYEHFVKLEQNRMMRFYRFANYFTDVPHLRGSIRRRAWLDFVYAWIPFKKEKTQHYLVFRTFVRTDDYFYLWLRLTVISAVIVVFVDIPVVTWIVVGALSFATTLQLKYALLSSGEFRMDMLYPVPFKQRGYAVETLLRFFMVIQAIIVTICGMTQPLFLFIPLIILVVSELTLRLTKGASENAL
ncbi:ABC transporter permease [Lysinibacillus sp. KU-BSD001]|uniref:ABC transporter permease n=1 Tax=Lysinibacillus sp. KU-BSD001 TaxID=3141328 RepID=UPI0036ED3260